MRLLYTLVDLEKKNIYIYIYIKQLTPDHPKRSKYNQLTWLYAPPKIASMIISQRETYLMKYHTYQSIHCQWIKHHSNTHRVFRNCKFETKKYQLYYGNAEVRTTQWVPYLWFIYLKPGLDTLIYFHYSILPKQKVRTKITTCREDGYWTNGTEVCRPPDNECSTVKLPSTTLYYDVELYATLSMADIE